MKRPLVIATVVVWLAAYAAGDLINFNFTVGPPASVDATPAGLSTGPSTLTSISDSTTKVIVPYTGNLIAANAGPMTNLVSSTGIVLIVFSAGGADSLLIEDSLSNVLVSGSMRDGSTLLSTIPPLSGTGAFLGTIDISFVSPTVLAMFGQDLYWPMGPIAFTTGGATFDPTTNTFTAGIGGGSLTIDASDAPEPASLWLVGFGLLAVASRYRRATHPPGFAGEDW